MSMKLCVAFILFFLISCMSHAGNSRITVDDSIANWFSADHNNYNEEQSSTSLGDDEVIRRMMVQGSDQGRYISYGALMRDAIPCNRKGVSYYNCDDGAPANPYHRACSVITMCARDLH